MKTRSVKQRLIAAVLVLVMLVTTLVGTTFAWFTDSVTSGYNKIVSGSLKVDLELLDKETDTWQSIKESKAPIYDYANWEPGYLDVKILKVENEGSLALKWKAKFVAEDGLSELANVIDVYVLPYGVLSDDSSVAYPAGRDLTGYTKVGTLAEFVNTIETTTTGSLLAGQSAYLGIALKMQESAGNEYQDMELGAFDVQIVATQFTSESDSFGNDYDEGAQWPEDVQLGNSASTNVTTNGDNTLAAEAVMTSADGKIAASAPEGTLLKPGTTALKLIVSSLEESKANIVLGEDEASLSLDVHVEGVAEGNTMPIKVYLAEALPKGLNMGNYTLYHVENGVTYKMTYVGNGVNADHNTFDYDPVTGDVYLYMASFSEVALVADEENAWEGNFDYSWYDADATELTIANADQLAAFGAIVGGMAEGIEQDSFADKTVKLIADINLGDAEAENNPDIIFYPIGYWNNEGTYERKPLEERTTAVESGFYAFSGTFDGNGHTVANFYQNTWEMKGDHNWYDTVKEQYYRDGMGLFGKVYGGTVKNLTVKNFSSDGEIATTGVIAAYADGATFENIAIFNCNPRVYNIGNGGIVGCVGWYAKEAGLKTTFKNITVDNTNKISALWGSWDTACGGILGQYYPTSGQSSEDYPVNKGVHFENCHVAAQIDVYNDVCANYQYYAYRYAGILIGSVRENVTVDGHEYPNMTGITASNCTVHFGDWNDYYYCELVANSLASYTHDHQMSRLEQVEKLDANAKKYLPLGKADVAENWVNIPSEGRQNYVVVNGKTADGKWDHGDGKATCYHFVNGVQHRHDVADSDNPNVYETVDGVEVLKEDKQVIYREFNNLVTGYGWGVTTKGVDDLAGVTILDRAEGNSVEKFKGIAKENYTTGTTVTINDLFAALENTGVDIKSQSIKVAVSPVGEGSTAGGTFALNLDNWTNSTLTFSGVGSATITITDYYFCTPTTINVTIMDKVAVEKFETKFTGDFLYRVGNQNAVKLDSLFKAIDGAAIGNVDVTIETITGASGTYTSNATWRNGTIQFSGTGVVKVTITDNDHCIPTELTLEVVDAVNATSATSAKSNNVVLLNDVDLYTIEVSNGYTLYGNGFKMTATSDPMYDTMRAGFVTLDNGTLDNVQVICPNFSYAIIYNSQIQDPANTAVPSDSTNDARGNVRSAVMVTGNSKIVNSYVHGGRAAIFLRSGNLLIDGSTISGGAAANIHALSAQSLTLRNATLIQKPFQATVHDTSKTLMGFSGLFECDADGNSTPLILEGTLVQDAWINENYVKYTPSAASSIVENALEKTAYLHDLDGDGKNESLNLGFTYIPQETNGKTAANVTDNRTNKSTVPYEAVVVGNALASARVYSYKNTNGTDGEFMNSGAFAPSVQGATSPSVSFTDTNADRVFETKFDASDGRWESTLSVNLDNGNYTFSFDKLLVQKHGANLTYTVKTADDTVVDTSKAIALTASGVTEYVLTVTDGDTTHTVYFILTASKTSIPDPVVADTTGGTPLLVVKSKNNDWSCALPALEGMKVKYYTADGEVILDLATLTPTKKGKQNGTNNYWETTATDGYKLKVTCGVIHDTKSVYGMPVVVDNNGTMQLYFTISSTNGYVSTGTAARSVTLTYEFTDPNGKTLTFTKNYNVQYADYKEKAQYSYNDFVNGTMTDLLTSGSGSGNTTCLTPDTLITLANGTQVRVDELTGHEELLVWNMETGKLDKAPIMFVDSDPAAELEVIKLHFSDGTVVNVLYEHGFWDYDLNKYVYLDANATDYIGHTFAKQNGDSLEKVQLVDVVIETEVTEAWSPVTEGHLCYFVNGMLSMPGGVGGLFNIFEVDAETMTYDYEAMQKDIETYGLFTYEELNAICPLSEEMFNAAGGAYLKISIGKGNLTMDELVYMITRYSKFFD